MPVIEMSKYAAFIITSVILLCGS